ncbi:uncharacterized protein IL334_006340 [Kwoniella shivajii]|uniref:Transcription factor domain-containing protein n=1 Tax=Kwoniella shivajii TaxID=564305 RepID=A0ABZ1D5P1_9TREE|nr:hypothetical protein IL334_006340 [Kwoniella shivajii]
MTVTTETRKILAAQGILRLNAIGLQDLTTLSRKQSTSQVSTKLDELCSVLYAMSALKFSGFIQVISQIQPIESVKNVQWLSVPNPKGTVQEKALITLCRTSWDILKQLPLATISDTDDVLLTISVMRLAVKIRIQQGSQTDDKRFRQLLAWSVILCAVHIQRGSLSTDKRKLLADGVMQVATAIDLEDMQPLIDIDDGPRGLYAEQYLWNQLLPGIINEMYFITRDVVSVGRNNPFSETRRLWDRLDVIFSWLDAITFAVWSSTRWDSHIIKSQKAMNVLRTLFYTELCVLHTDVLYAKSIQSQVSSGDFGLIEHVDLINETQSRIEQGFKRIARGLKLVMPSTPLLSDLFQILDNVSFICSVIGDSLPEQADRLALENMNFFWDCPAWKIITMVGNGIPDRAQQPAQ